MKVVYFLFIFGFISCVGPYGTVIDVWYNYEYSLLNDYTRDYNQWNFRLPVVAGDKMDMEIKIPKGAAYGFNIEVFQFSTSEAPTDPQINYPGTNPIDPIGVSQRTHYEEGNYDVYNVTYQAYNYITYFGIHILLSSYNPYTYLIFRVNLSKYKYSNIKDLNFNQEYQIDTSIFGDSLIPHNYQIYIRLAAIEQDNMEVQIDTHVTYNRDNDFKVNVCQYTYKPTETQVYYPTYDSLCKDPLKNESKEDKKYRFPFTTDKDTTYLSIRIINNDGDLDYLYLLIYSEKGLAAAIIAVIVIVPLLVIGGIVYAVLRKCGCINKDN